MKIQNNVTLHLIKQTLKKFEICTVIIAKYISNKTIRVWKITHYWYRLTNWKPAIRLLCLSLKSSNMIFWYFPFQIEFEKHYFSVASLIKLTWRNATIPWKLKCTIQCFFSVTIQSTEGQVHFSDHSVTIQCYSVTISSSFSHIHFSFYPYMHALFLDISDHRSSPG